MTINGTSNFVSFTKACDYYRYQEEYTTPAELEAIIRRKLDEGDIEIGQPDIKAGEKLSIIDDGTRYAIESN